MIKEQRVEGAGLLKGTIKLAKEVMMEGETPAGTAKLSEAQRMLLTVARLASPKELPKDFYENGQRIWTAWNLGRDYERLTEKEKPDA